MTDYSSQGKTREFNVVHLNNCKTHFSYYTALSRSSTSAGTVILQGMASWKVTKGIDGYLRQEFRELELLNEITKLRYENNLPSDVKGLERREILRAYQIWKGGAHELSDLHHAVRWKKGDAPLIPARTAIGNWGLVGEDKPKEKTFKDQNSGRQGEKRKGSQLTTSIFTPMFDVWQEHGPKWTHRFEQMNAYGAELAHDFISVQNKTGQLEPARDSVRKMLRRSRPTLFPVGPVLTGLDDLTQAMFGNQFWGTRRVKCTRCDEIIQESPGFEGSQTITYEKTLKDRYKHNYCVSHWLNSRKIQKSNGKCSNCGNGLTSFITVDVAPPMLYI
ncbi:hypothetical protein B0H13DRAFT_1859657 [Mycena leptocephala]|nr:hypothetical protein B0H13DRAFT_1859657 [Mycena leptocephala]